MIAVFKTSVKSKKDIQILKPHLNKILQQATWNFDLEDCDNILRIDSLIEKPASIIKLLHDIGFDCEELPD